MEGSWTVAPPRPPQRGADPFAPARSIFDQIRTGEIETLSGEVFGFDELLVGADGAIGRR